MAYQPEDGTELIVRHGLCQGFRMEPQPLHLLGRSAIVASLPIPLESFHRLLNERFACLKASANSSLSSRGTYLVGAVYTETQTRPLVVFA